MIEEIQKRCWEQLCLLMIKMQRREAKQRWRLIHAFCVQPYERTSKTITFKRPHQYPTVRTQE